MLVILLEEAKELDATTKSKCYPLVDTLNATKVARRRINIFALINVR